MRTTKWIFFFLNTILEINTTEMPSIVLKIDRLLRLVNDSLGINGSTL